MQNLHWMDFPVAQHLVIGTVIWRDGRITGYRSPHKNARTARSIPRTLLGCATPTRLRRGERYRSCRPQHGDPFWVKIWGPVSTFTGDR